MHLYNWLAQIAFDAAFFAAFGWRPLFFMVFCIFLAGGLHPCAGHFISEHYVFPHKSATQETYSYYGYLNWLTFNVGYHNEHHDFPYVPWSRLPELKRIAPEFYDNLEVCESWVGVIWDYVMRPEVGPFNRVKRKMDVKAGHDKDD
jgi:sphingolipid delta-4 desaturase